MMDSKKIIRNVYKLAKVKDVAGAFTSDGTFTDESIQVIYRGQNIGKTIEIYAAAFPDISQDLSVVFSWRHHRRRASLILRQITSTICLLSNTIRIRLLPIKLGVS